MDIELLKTGDVFYYEDYTPHNNKTHRHKCRVLFVGSENLFYDVFSDGIDKWSFVPVSKRLCYYRFPLTHLHRLTFDGFEAIDPTSVAKLFLLSPEILLRTPKNKIYKSKSGNKKIRIHSETFYFIPTGPKEGWLKPILFDSKLLTNNFIIQKVLETQNLDFIQLDDIVIHRVGLHKGVLSYSIRTR